MPAADPDRSVLAVVTATETLEGAGFRVRRPFPTRPLDHLDPFLLLDEMGPMELGPGEAKGAPDHPHRGFETVTYLLDGEMVHRDSRGGGGLIRPGQVQWMTAGAGVVHSEMPSAAFQKTGGRMHGFQLWVNLPRAEKMTPARYQGLGGSTLPTARTADGLAEVKVIAGEALGVRAATATHTPILYVHATLQPGGDLSLPVAAGWNAFAYVFEGRARVGRDRREAPSGSMVILKDDGAVVRLASEGQATAQVLVLAGRPIGEPVARHGPFVMSTEPELRQAFEDFRAGRMGQIPAEVARQEAEDLSGARG
jgi:redox-sensitive bicupin YhaK (pirin superfamily)